MKTSDFATIPTINSMPLFHPPPLFHSSLYLFHVVLSHSQKRFCQRSERMGSDIRKRLLVTISPPTADSHGTAKPILPVHSHVKTDVKGWMKIPILSRCALQQIQCSHFSRLIKFKDFSRSSQQIPWCFFIVFKVTPKFF